MNRTNLTARVIDQVVESRDDNKILAEVAAKITPHLPELSRAIAEAASGPESGGERDSQAPRAAAAARALNLLTQLLARLEAQDLREFYYWVADQGERFALNGIGFDELLRCLRLGEQTTFPVLLRVLAPGPELDLALAALDSLGDNLVTVMAAAYIGVLQDQVSRGARLQSVGRLAGGVAHSMNNLLAAILGRTQLLLHSVNDDRLRPELEEIQTAALRGARTLRRLQQYAVSLRENQLVEIDVNEIVREAAELTRYRWRDEAEAAGIVIDVVRDLADVPPIRAAPGVLREVLVNLIFNAIEAMPQGGLVTLRTERVKDRVLVSVSDTGEGMPEEVRRRVFDPFFTTKGPSHAGLGLARVREAMAVLKGEVEASSKLGQGSSLTLSFPVAEELAASKPAQGTQPISAARVLVIDDEPSILQTAGLILHQHGHVVSVAETGPEGRRLLEQEGPFDVVVTDLGMPGMSGWEVASLVKERWPQTLVILMTGWAADMDPRKIKESGVSRVLQKPFDAQRVLEIVNEALSSQPKP